MGPPRPSIRRGYAEEEVSIVKDAPHIAETDRRMPLLHGTAFAFDFGFGFGKLVYDLDRPSSVRHITGVNETNATFRFPQIRLSESWNNPDLDGYRLDKSIAIDIKPATTTCRT